MKKFFLLSVLVWGFSASAAVQPPVEADNSAVNARDRGGQNLTAQDQTKGSMTDVELTRIARQRLVKDRELSMNGKNVKIITIDRVMTLRGPVASQAEKMRILDHARAVSSSVQVVDNLEIKR